MGNKIVYIKHREVEGVNKHLIDIIADLNQHNFLESIRILKLRYGINQMFISEITGIHYTAISKVLNHDKIDNWISVKTLEKAIERMKIHFLRDVEIINTVI